MIISKLSGGLGNQLFQYAIGRALAINNNTDLLFDDFFYTSVYNSELQRTCLLEKFHTKYTIANQNDINNILSKKNLLRAFKRHILRKKIPYYLENCIEEKEMYFDSNMFKCNKNVYINGYWPNQEYFLHIRDVLLKEIKLRPEYISNDCSLLQKKINSTSNSISIHIRRGDYLLTHNGTNQLFGICSLDYYNNAISYITQYIQNPKFFVFTDDVQWVIDNFECSFPWEIISSPKLHDYEELEIMSLCKHNIIANSTFSWWGAWLNQNPEKIIIAPKKWYSNKDFQYFYEHSDFVPKSWIRL